jgi:hypothetical protein
VEQERQARSAAEAEVKRMQAEQQRLAALRAEEDRKAKAAAEAEAKRKAEEQQRQANIRAEQERQARAAAEAEAKRFTIQRSMEATGRVGADEVFYKLSIEECEQKCAQRPNCNVFTYTTRRATAACYLYTRADLVPNADFHSGVRK